MSSAKLVGRIRGLVAGLNRDRYDLLPSEYDALFPARWEVVVNLASRSDDPFSVLFRPGESEVTTARGRYLDTVIEYDRRNGAIVADPAPKRWHPVVFTAPKYITAGFKTRAGWNRAGRGVRWDATPSHYLAGRLPHGSRSGWYEELLDVADTYVTPRRLLALTDWPEGTEGFLAKLREDGRDATDWLVMADWLQEHGHQDRAEDIRRYWDWKRVGIVD